MNGVIYARYSSHNQTEQSIEGQIEGCMEFAKAKDIRIIGTYIDRALSARTANRPEFLRMINDSAKKQFDFVIVYTLDRFSRDRYDSAIFKAKLKKNGVKVLSAKENIGDGIESILVESLLEGMAEYYSAELARKVKRGLLLSAEKCKSLGTLPLGYKAGPGGEIVIDEDVAPAIREIFELYVAGETGKDIVEKFNNRGYRTTRGNKLNSNSLYRIITNKKYIGEYKFSDILIEDGIPAIIDKQLFEEAQKRVKEYKHAPGSNKGNYLLTSRLYCGICKSSMVGESGKGKSGEIYNYYTCLKRKKVKDGDERCTKKPIPKKQLEDFIVERTVKYVLRDDVIDYIATKFMEIRSKEKSDGREKNLNKSLDECNKAIGNLVEAITKGINSSAIKQKLSDLELKKADLEEELAKERLKDTVSSKDEIIALLKSYRSQDTKNEQYRRLLIRSFVNYIVVYDDKIVIAYNYDRPDSVLACSDLTTLVAPTGFEPVFPP